MELTNKTPAVEASPSDPNMSINYFYSLNNVDADKRSSSAMMQTIHMRFGNIFNGIGCFEGTHSHCSSNQTASHTKPHLDMWLMHCRNLLKKSYNACRKWTSSHHLELMRHWNGVIALCWYPKLMVR